MQIADPTVSGQWVTAEWNMTGNAAWMTNTITSFRPGLGVQEIRRYDDVSLATWDHIRSRDGTSGGSMRIIAPAPSNAAFAALRSLA